MKRILNTASISLCSLMLFSFFYCSTGSSPDSNTKYLVKGFVSPPGESRPNVMWWWLNSNISKTGITRDLEEMKRQGIGGALMNFAESRARENNFSELRLTTHVLLKENISLYRHLGWEETDRDKARVYMKKKL